MKCFALLPLFKCQMEPLSLIYLPSYVLYAGLMLTPCIILFPFPFSSPIFKTIMYVFIDKDLAGDYGYDTAEEGVD